MLVAGIYLRIMANVLKSTFHVYTYIPGVVFYKSKLFTNGFVFKPWRRGRQHFLGLVKLRLLRVDNNVAIPILLSILHGFQ